MCCSCCSVAVKNQVIENPKFNSIYLYKYIEIFLCGGNGKIKLQHCNTATHRPQNRPKEGGRFSNSKTPFLAWRKAVSLTERSRVAILSILVLTYAGNNLDGNDAPVVHFHDLEGEILVGNLLVERGELALDFEQEACECVGIALDLLEILVVEVHNAIEIGEKGLGLEDIGIVVQALVALLGIIVFVVYLTYDFLDDVLHCNYTAGSSKFVYDYSNVYFVLLEIAQQVVYHLGLGDEIWCADQGLPAEIGWFLEVREQVLDIEDSLDIVFVTAIYGYAAVVVLDYALYDLGEGCTDVEVHDVYAGCHDLACHLAAKAYDALEHLALLCNVFLVGELHCLLQVIDGKGFGVVLYNAVGEGLAHHQQRGQGPEHLAQEQHYLGHGAAEGQRMLGAVNLGHDLAEQEQKECEEYGEYQELYPLTARTEAEPFHEEIVEQYDDGYVDEVVEYQYGGKEPVGVAAQAADAAVAGAVFLVEL